MITRILHRHIRFFCGLLREAQQASQDLVRHLKETAGLAPGTELSRNDVRVELSNLGLIGNGFTLDQIIKAVEDHLGIIITPYDYPDLSSGVVPDYDLKAGDLAALTCNDERTEAILVVRESLKYRPWPAYVLSVLHELGHLLAGHHLQRPHHSLDPSTLKLEGVHSVELSDSELAFEIEARRWAKALLLAHSVPEVFEGERTNRPT